MLHYFFFQVEICVAFEYNWCIKWYFSVAPSVCLFVDRLFGRSVGLSENLSRKEAEVLLKLTRSVSRFARARAS